MSVGALTSSAAKPDVADLLVRARTIAEVARERAQQTETERRVGDDMIERMRQADLFRVMQPRLYGGFEYGFDVFAQIAAAIASGRSPDSSFCAAATALSMTIGTPWG